MSKTVDQRVVQMQFDNAHFERNVATTMSTLDKLKQKLNFKGTAQGLENVGSAAKKVDMSGLSNGVGTVQAKFSALEVMGVTALANITNSAVNAGKRIVSALTIDPVKTGFQEYETQINATQTILANTKSKGSTIDDVNKALEELNKYADLTIYNFTEMTRNIGTFTAAGIDLDTSVNAIQGIANLAAVSGSTSQQASTAMYQLSQALAAGTVKLMDWNSVVNAGMGGEMFQNALKETSELLGTGAEAAIKAEGSFRESLRTGWLTSEVLTETLKTFTASGATEKVAEYTGLTKEAVQAALDSAEAQYGEADAIKYASKALAEKSGKSAEEIQNTLEFAKNAQDAATKVKTFTQLWDVLKESAQSGWAQTWKILVGDFEEAKSLITPLADYLTAFISKMSDFRNTLLEKALDNPFADLLEKINNVTGATEEMVSAVKDYGVVVDKVLGGEFGNGQARWDKLTEAGYDWAKVQNMVNEKLGSSVRHTEQLNEAQQSANETQTQTIAQLLKKTDAQLKTIGFTEKEIEALRELEAQSAKTGIPIEDLIKDMDKLSGRSLLINSFKNAGQGLVAVLTALKNAWVNAFPPMTSEQLYNIIAGLHKFSTHLRVSEETADKFERTFKGVFAIIDIVATVVGGAARIAFKAFTQLLGMFNMDILDFTAMVGDAIVKFRDWIDASLDFTKAFEFLAPYVKIAADAFVRLKEAASGSSHFKAFADTMSSIGEALKNWMAGIKDADNIPQYLIEGLVNGLKNGVKDVWNAALELGLGIWESICAFFDMHSPSRKMEGAGENIIAGLVNGIQNGASALWDSIKNIGTKFVDILSKIDWGAVLVAGFGAGMLVIGNKFVNVLDKFASPFEKVGDMFGGIGTFFEDLGKGLEKNFKAKALERKSNALKNFAIAIGILAVSVALLSKLDPTGMAMGIGALVVLAGVVVALTKVVDKLGSNGVVEIGKLSVLLLGVSTALLIMAVAVNKLAAVSIDDLAKGVVAVGLLGVIIVGLIAATKLFNKDATKIGTTLLAMSAAMILLVLTIKMISGMEPDALSKGLLVVAAFGGVFAGLTAVTKLFGKDAASMGMTMLKMALAIKVLAIVTKMVSGMDPRELAKGMTVVAVFGVMLAGLVGLTNLFDKDAAKVGGTLLGMAAAIGLLVVVAKLAASMSPGDIVKGVVVITAFGALCAALVASTSFVTGNDLKRVGSTILAMSLAIGVMAAVAALLGLVKLDNLAQGIIAVGLLTAMMVAMTKATQHATDVKGTMIGLAIAIGVLAAAVAVLSFIDPAKLAPAVGAMTLLMGAMALLVMSTKSLNGVEKITGKLILMMGIVVLLGGIVAALSFIPNVGTALQASAAIAILMTSMAVSLRLISTIGPTATTAIGALAIMGLVVAELAVILGLMAHFNVAPSIETAASLSILLLAMSGACLILAGVGAAGPAAYIGIGALATLIAGIGGLIVGIGALVTEFPKLQEFLSTGIPVLEQIGYALGSFFGNIIGGFLGNLTSGFPDMATDLSNFMTNLQPFVNGAKNINADTVAGVESLASALLALTTANIADGLASWLPGVGSLSDFVNEFAGLGEPLAKLATDLGSFTPEQLASVKLAGEALAVMADAAKGVNGQADWSKKIFGDNSISKFAEEICAFVSKLSGLGTFTKDQLTTVKNAASAVDVMGKAAKKADGQAEWSKKLFGDNSLSAFAGEIKSFVSKLSGLGTFTKEQVNTVKNASSAISAIAKAAKGVDGQADWSKKIFGDNSLSAFAEDIKGFVTTLSELDTTVVDKFAESLNKLGESCVDELIKGFTDAETDVKDSAKKIANAFIDAVKDKRSDFKSAGKYLVEGFASGISVNTYKAKAAARAMAKAAARAAEQALDINSPSRVGFGIGDFFGLGFVNGMKSYISTAGKVGTAMAASARTGLSEAVSKIQDFISSDIDAQPTIRPVLDLSDIKSGASTLSSLFNSTAPIAAYATAGSIGTVTARSSQNGSNAEVVSAIDKLRKDMGNVERATYNINGITYDDGSNLRDAIETIVRYAQIERRK